MARDITNPFSCPVKRRPSAPRMEKFAPKMKNSQEITFPCGLTQESDPVQLCENQTHKPTNQTNPSGCIIIPMKAVH